MEFITALRGTSFDDQKPSLFELLAEQQLAALLPPTLRYLLVHATYRAPRYLLPVLNAFDELYALLHLVVERHYLRTRGGTFTEYFYGLKREAAPAVEVPRAAARAPAAVRRALQLRGPAALWRSLAVAVGVPYLQRRLADAHAADAPRALLGPAHARLPPRAPWRARLAHHARWCLRSVYPRVHAAYCLALLAFHLAYLFDNAKAHSPLLWLIGARVRRMTAADYSAVEALSQEGRDKGAGPGPTSLFSPSNMGAKVLGSLSVLLPTSIFALKFLEWWYQSGFAKQLSRRAAESLDLPPPTVSRPNAGSTSSKPTKPNPASAAEAAAAVAAADDDDDDDEVDAKALAERAPIAMHTFLPIYTVRPPANSALCPICADDITMPTACQTGVVYCYACIHRWVAGEHPRQEAFMAGKEGKWESGAARCAVTGRRVLGGTEGLRRIMVS